MTSPPATSSIPPPTSPAPSPRHDDPTGQAGAPAREGWRHPHVTRWSRVSNGDNAMNTTTVRTRFVLILALLVFATFAATSSTLACVVGTGTSASCTEAALDACLPGGGSFDGTVTFACGGAATITVTNSTFSGNSAVVGGGAIAGGGTVTNCTFSGNRAVGHEANELLIRGVGGAISGGGTVTNCTFSGNSAGIGGIGGAISGGGTVT